MAGKHLTEYLYCDERRLDDYVQQTGLLSVSLKTPKIGFTFGLTGPKIEASQERSARSLTRHEKIQKLIGYLKAEDLVSQDRPYCKTADEAPNPKRDFVLETCRAVRVLVPPNESKFGSLGGFGLWVSSSPMRAPNDAAIPPGLLCLLEDSPSVDEPSRFAVSAYTAFSSIVVDLGGRFSTTVLASAFSRVADSLPLWRKSVQYMSRFIQRPMETLSDLGCEFGDERAVQVLYRVRAFGPEEADRRRTVSTFGYPIVIHL